MRILTFSNSDLDRSCMRLAALVASSGFNPELIVGIASGGAVVARALARDERFCDAGFVEIICRRPLSRIKGNSFLIRAVKGLPKLLTDLLRRLEHWIAMGAARYASARPTVTCTPACVAAISGVRRILVVDDAVDSGATLASVLLNIEALNRSAEIRSAAIVITFSSPQVIPDYYLLKDVLVRFPWSVDAV